MHSQIEVTEILVFREHLAAQKLRSVCIWKWDLESVLVMVDQLNPRVWVLGFLITMPRENA